jgi:hypothetical protein
VLGGLAVAAAGARSAFVLDAASSVVAALLVTGIRGNVGGSANHARDRSHDDMSMLAGIRVLAGDPILRLLVAAWSGLVVCFAFVTAAELPLAVDFGVDELGLGAIVSTWCAGSLLGAWLARRVDIERRGARVLAGNALVCATVFVGTGLAPTFWAVLVLMAVGGCSMAVAEVVESTFIQQRIDDAVRARVLAAYQGLFAAIWGSNLALAGLFVGAFSPQAAYIYGGVWCLVGVIGFCALGIAMRRHLLAHTLRVLVPRHALESELVEGA